jgi:hypothetical protein
MFLLFSQAMALTHVQSAREPTHREHDLMG